MKPIRVAIVGCGRISDLHQLGYQGREDARITAVCDTSRARSRVLPQRSSPPMKIGPQAISSLMPYFLEKKPNARWRNRPRTIRSSADSPSDQTMARNITKMTTIRRASKIRSYWPCSKGIHWLSR